MLFLKQYDVIIVGAGPAGMFAANELADKYDILVVDKGRDILDRNCKREAADRCVECNPCDIMCGVGGSGTFSDGTLNLRPDIGGNLDEYTCDTKRSEELVDAVDKIFVKYGAPESINTPSSQDIEDLKRKAASVGAYFIDIKQRHIGSDKTPDVIKNFKDYLTGAGIEFLVKKEVLELVIENKVCKGVEFSDGSKVYSDKVILAPGRVGARWADDIANKYNITKHFAPLDVGVRVEVPAIVMDPVTNINRDPKFHIRSKTYDDLTRTFCTNEHGFVVKETYNGSVGVNGHSMKYKRSENTNFAFLVQQALTEPQENTIKYGKSLAKLATTIGGGKPIVQKMGDLRRGRRSTQNKIDINDVKNTLKHATPGDISMALTRRIAQDIIEGLETLDKIIPGVASDSTLLYAPEIKFYSNKLIVDENLETSISNLFAAGDGTGLSRDIVNAAATGMLAAKGILNKDGR